VEGKKKNVSVYFDSASLNKINNSFTVGRKKRIFQQVDLNEICINRASTKR
jgi:hypothetical protein